ncbi:MAG: double-strand break repair protein AddB [Hyphomicrobiales bacterium]|nr:double-strand break repair protein AddB [Hyphomicrobiales bacterium]MCP5001376.1 double-strand break repair protein AddB [Hyphomicrobiales bacterium]
MTTPRLFTIDPGVPFLHQLARSLCDGELIEGFRHQADNPLLLSTATIYVPTRRASRALRSEFVDFIGRKAAILPTIRTLGENDDDAGFLEEDQPALLDLVPPVAKTERLLELAQLIMLWKQNLPKSVSDFHGDNRLIAPANPADAVWLACSLAELLEAMETGNRPWSALSDLVGDDYAHWWQLTLEFLKIASSFWPARLTELDRADPAAHRNAILLSEAARLSENPPSGPVIVAGSTGSIPATAEMMKVVAALDQGAVVLPGLDTALDDTIWELVGGKDPELIDPAICSHPQYGLHVLLRGLHAQRADIVKLGRAGGQTEMRNMLVSTALMPAEATAQWASQAIPPGDAARAFATVELIEAANEREEAHAIAAAMRLAADRPPQGDSTTADQPPQHVALVTPDRNLARRVTVELRRFGIEANDSGGAFLALSLQGTLLQLLLQSAFGGEKTVALVGLMKHPLMRLDRTAGAARKAARIVERVALRGGAGDTDIAALADLLETKLAARGDNANHAPHWQKRLTDDDVTLARDLAARLQTAFSPLLETREAAVSDWARLTAQLLEILARDENGSLAALWGDEAGEKLASLFASIMENRSGFSCNGADWAAMIPALIAGELVKPRAGGHPHIFIWGVLEARLQHVDTLILAGLNEGTWPSNVAGDPFLSRAMKTAIGLDTPERRIGLAAHDFQMGLGADHVILSRAARSANAPTVASRWLQRLSAVIGNDETERLRARGNRYIHWASMLDERPDTQLATRPAPKPPAELQPKRYSFSEIRTLRRDPYAVYAKRVLKLDPPEALIRDPGPAERGTLYHRILERFIAKNPDLSMPDAAGRLHEIAKTEFDCENLPDYVGLVWRMQFDRIAVAFVDWEQSRESAVTARFTECRAKMQLQSTGITLSGIADRIDVLAGGEAELLDYKTGSSPSRKQAWTLLDPQLPLEAAALRAGAFADVGRLEPASLAYVRLKPEEVLKVDRIEGGVRGYDDTKSAAELGDESIERLNDLIAAFANGNIGFASQVIPESAAHYGHDYDHLARVREWSSADAGDADGGDA